MGEQAGDFTGVASRRTFSSIAPARYGERFSAPPCGISPSMFYGAFGMKRDTPSLPRCLPTLRRVGGSWLMWLYLLTGTPLVPSVTTLLAMADRSHQVAVQQTGVGIRVVLRHRCVTCPAHRHGIIARALTLIAQRPAEGHPDHVIQFAASAVSQRAPALALTPAARAPAPELFPPPCDLRPCPALLTSVLAAHPRPPPDAGGLLISLRSTVLLI